MYFVAPVVVPTLEHEGFGLVVLEAAACGTPSIVTAVGGLSLVVPDFAVRSFSVKECAVYRLTQDGRWAEVNARQATTLICVVEDRR